MLDFRAIAPPTAAVPDRANPMPETRHPLLAERSLTVPAMGGSLHLRVAFRPRASDVESRVAVATHLGLVARRVERWAARLTRFTESSDLSALNAHPQQTRTWVPPTLAAVLDWAERAVDLGPDLLNVTLLDERLAVEASSLPERAGRAAPDSPPTALGPRPSGQRQGRCWHLVREQRGAIVVRHEPCRFDLDGVAKGWIADRALALLDRYPAALVDADGDIAIRVGSGVAWDIGIADPRGRGRCDLACLRLHGRLREGRMGVATSGTSVHRWPSNFPGSARHHLLDPRTRLPADTDVVQATVVAASAREAEVLAKAAVIAGSSRGIGLLDQGVALGAVLLLVSGEVIATPRTREWLA